jgi:precorrin-2 dehydrogenase/sirohydrochlorin ferrochelatase
MLDVSDRLIVIVGGGGVAARKAAGLLAAGATRVRIVAPAFHDDVPADVERVLSPYEPRHLEGAALIFAATDSPEVNAAVVTEARRRGILVNRADADEAGAGDFATPAVLREGAITITVSAAGNPAIAAKVRDVVKDKLDARWIALADAMVQLRPAILASGLSGDERRDLFRNLATDDAAEAAHRGGLESLRMWIEQQTRAKLNG